MSKKHTEDEAVLARERKLNNQRQWAADRRKEIRALRTGANQCNSIWTSERHLELVALFDKKLPTSEIGRLMGLTKNMVNAVIQISSPNLCAMAATVIIQT